VDDVTDRLEARLSHISNSAGGAFAAACTEETRPVRRAYERAMEDGGREREIGRPVTRLYGEAGRDSSHGSSGCMD